MTKKILFPFFATFVLASVQLAQAQQGRVYRIGVVHEGGSYAVVVEGLKDGLKKAGLAEGKDYVLESRNLEGDRKRAESAARSLERGKVDLIYTVSTTVTTAVKHATTEVPIVFAVGSDPVVSGLVEGFPRPGGRLTGVHYQASADVIAKRLETLKALVPGLRRVVTFYDPNNANAVAAANAARQASRQLDVELVERHVASVDELRASLNALKPQDAEAYYYINDAMISSQAQLVIDAARARKLPTMFGQTDFAEKGALASYGVSFTRLADCRQNTSTECSPGPTRRAWRWSH